MKTKIITTEAGQGLIEAVVALAIIGIVMVGITLVTIRSMRIARENELEDVATQALVEAVDYLKAPGTINAYISNSNFGAEVGESIHEDSNFLAYGGFFKIDDSQDGGYKLISEGNAFANPQSGCDENSPYALTSLQDVGGEIGYDVCVQIYINPREDSGTYDVYVLGYWSSSTFFTSAGVPKVNKLNAFRSADIVVSSQDGGEYMSPTCFLNCTDDFEEIEKAL